MLGKSLLDTFVSNGGHVIDQESYSWFGAHSQKPYEEVIQSIMLNYDITSPQLKIASNNNQFIEQAGRSGNVSVTGIKELAFALFIFSDLTADKVDELSVNNLPFTEYTGSYKFGDFTLSGVQIGRIISVYTKSGN